MLVKIVAATMAKKCNKMVQSKQKFNKFKQLFEV